MNKKLQRFIDYVLYLTKLKKPTMKIKKCIFSFLCVLVLFATACTSDDITSEESRVRETALQPHTTPISTDVRIVKDEVIIVVDTMETKRVLSNNHSSTRPRRRD